MKNDFNNKLPNLLVDLELNGMGYVMTVSKHVPINEGSSNAHSDNFIRCTVSSALLLMTPFAALYEMRKAKLLDSFGASAVAGLGVGAINTIATSFFMGIDAIAGSIDVAAITGIITAFGGLYSAVNAAENNIGDRGSDVDNVNKYFFTATADAAVTAATVITANIMILSQEFEKFATMTSEGSVAFEELSEMSEEFPCMEGWDRELEIKRHDRDFLELRSICKSGPILGEGRKEVINYAKELSILNGADFSYIGLGNNYGEDVINHELLASS